MKKKRSFLLWVLAIIIMSIFITIFAVEIFGSDSPNAEIESMEIEKGKIGLFAPLYQKEEESVGYFYKEYKNIANLYDELVTGKVPLEEFVRQINAISPNVNAQFNKIEDFRLSYRYKISKEDMKSEAFNDIYSYGYRTRWRLQNFINVLEQKDLTISLIKNKYKEEIIEGYELELPVLLDILSIPATKYPLNGEKKKQKGNSLENIEVGELRSAVINNLSNKWDINEIQIRKMDHSTILILKIVTETTSKDQLIFNSVEMIKSMFEEYSEISEVSIFWQNENFDSIFVLGFERIAFYSYLQGGKPTQDIPKFSFLYNNSLTAN